MQSTKFTVGVQFFFGPFLNRTTLEPTERLRRERDEEALQQLEESRRHALEEIEELLRSMQP
jgi:vacuolar-type H+-ATPase subunit E/Vma4